MSDCVMEPYERVFLILTFVYMLPLCSFVRALLLMCFEKMHGLYQQVVKVGFLFCFILFSTKTLRP